MVQAIIDPQEVRRFASNLKNYSDSLMEQTTRIRTRFTELGETWRDQEYQKFAAEFQQTAESIARFYGRCAEYIPYLQRKAEAAEHYLHQQ